MSPTIPRSGLPATAAGFLLVYVLAWTVLPALLSPSLPLDVVEGITWGHEWQWGYYKHPPLPAWLLYPAFRALGWYGPYLVSQLCILLALAYVYRMAREFMDAPRAWLAAALPYTIYYYTWPTLEFNHNIAQIPVWAALAWHTHRAVRRGRPGDWMWLGVWGGIGVLAKYSTGVLMACLGAYLLLRPQRALWRGPGPWLAVGVACVVAAPHLAWLVANDALPLTYLAGRSQQVSRLAAAGTVAAFLGAQVLVHVPLLLVLLFGGVRPWHWRPSRLPARERGWLFTIGLAPALLTALVALVSGLALHDMWGTPMWNFSGLLILAGLPAERVLARSRGILRGVGSWMLLLTLAMALYLAQAQQWRGRPSRMDWPLRAVASQAQQQWAQLSTCPLQLLSGDPWVAGLVAIGATPMPSILISGDYRLSPWLRPDDIERHGVLVVWPQREGASDEERFQIGSLPEGMSHAGSWSVAWPRAPEQAPLQLGWRAWVPRHCAR